MTIIEHLQELRTRILISLIAVALGTIAGWILYPQVFHILIHSYQQACRQLPKKIHPIKCTQLVVNGVLEPFIIRFKISLFTGLAFALPVVLYELWAFITPGLTSRERRYAVPFVLSSVALFALGGWFAFWTLPRGLHFLLGFAGNTLAILLTANKYISFVLLMVFAFGISFEFPLVLIFLTWVRVLSSRRLRQWRRMAYLSITIFAAVITPSQDPYTQLAMMVPMIVFYEVAIWVSRLLRR